MTSSEAVISLQQGVKSIFYAVALDLTFFSLFILTQDDGLGAYRELRNNLDSHNQHRRGKPAASLSEHTGLLRAFRFVRQ